MTPEVKYNNRKEVGEERGLQVGEEKDKKGEVDEEVEERE